ncbi:MAG: hypothetical protein N2D54_01220, partial [Chloroflexota bacterium]
MKISQLARRKLVLISSLLIIVTLILAACGPALSGDGDLAGAGGAGGKGGGKTGNNNNDDDDNSKGGGKSGDNNNNDDNSKGGGKSGDNNNDDSGKNTGKSGDDDDDDSGKNTGKSGDDDDDDSGKNTGKSGDDDDDDGKQGKGEGHTPVSLCHATGSESNPYVEITIDDDGVIHGHEVQHPDDIIPAPNGGCPKKPRHTPPPKITLTPGEGCETNQGKGKGKGCYEPVTLCHATHSATNPWVEITIDNQGEINGHSHHPNDIIPAPDGGCPVPSVTPTPPPSETPEPTETPITPDIVVTESPERESPPKDLVIEPVVALCVNFTVFHTFRTGNLEIFRLDDN